jgi:hypothetical protein
MSIAEIIYQKSLHLPEQAAYEVLDFIQFLEQRYQKTVNDSSPAILTPEQKAAYTRLSALQINWKGKPITDRDEINER